MDKFWQYIEAFGVIIFYFLKIGVQKLDDASRPARELATKVIRVLKFLAIAAVIVPPIILILGIVMRSNEMLATAGCISAFAAFILLYGSSQFGELFAALDLPLKAVKTRMLDVGNWWVRLLQGYLLTLTALTLFVAVLPVFDYPFQMALLFIALMGMAVMAMRSSALSRVFAAVVYTFVILMFLGCAGFLVIKAVQKASHTKGNIINEVMSVEEKRRAEQAVRDSIALVDRLAAIRQQATRDSLDRLERERLARIEAQRPRVEVRLQTIIRETQVASQPVRPYEPPVVAARTEVGESPPPRSSAPSYPPIPSSERPVLWQQADDGGWFSFERSSFISSSRSEARFRFQLKCAPNWNTSYVLYDMRRKDCDTNGEFVLPNLGYGRKVDLIFHLVCSSQNGDESSEYKYSITNN